VKIKVALFWILFVALITSGSFPGAPMAQVRPVVDRTGNAGDEAEEEPEEDKGIVEDEEEDVIKINFPEMDLESILKNFSAITGRSFVLDQIPKGQVYTIGPIGPVEIPRDQAMNLFVLIMDLNGFNVVETSIPGVFKVVRKAEALKENIPIYAPGKRPEINESMVTRFVPLEYIPAQEVASQLTQLASKDGGQVIAYAPTNTLIMVDSALNIERMIKVLDIIDVPTAEPEIEIVPLRYSQAQEISGILSQIFQASPTAATARTATTRDARAARARRRPPRAPQPQAAAAPQDEGPKIIPVERTNSLIVIAEPDMIESVKELIAKLDVDVGEAGTIHVYYVQNAEATDLASTLSGISGKQSGLQAPSAAQAAGGAAARRQPTTTRTQRPQTSNASGESIIKGALGGEISITADEPTNSLIIVASQQDYAILKKVIEKLDLPRRQVFVEAVLLEITYNENADWGVSAHGASPLEDGGVVLAGSAFSEPSSLSILGSLSSGTLALPSGITVGALGRPVELGDTGQSVPSSGMILRMLATSNNVNVLSTPTLLTTDNEEASIEVGQKIPVPTGQTVGTGGLSQVSISRESVGIKLRLTPQINESDNIRLEIFTEISGAVSSGLGIDVNQLGVTTSIKTAETTVIVRDSQTIVIGGLMEDKKNESSSKVPFFGDIPVIGWLFKTSSRGNSKTNLVILLTPHIVKSDHDTDRVKERMQNNYQDLLEESLGEEVEGWDRYFESQLRGEESPIIDLREGGPQMVEPPQWEWTPEEPGMQPEVNEGDTVQPEGSNSGGSRSANTMENQ